MVATFAGVLTVLTFFMAQARRGSGYDHLKTELQAFFVGITNVCRFGPGFGLKVVFMTWNENQKTGSHNYRIIYSGGALVMVK